MFGQVSWLHGFLGFHGFEGFAVSVVSLVSWFPSIFSQVSWVPWFHLFSGCHGLTGFTRIMVSLSLPRSRFLDVTQRLGFTSFFDFIVSLVSWVSRFHWFFSFHGFTTDLINEHKSVPTA